MLRDEIAQYTELSGNDGLHTPIGIIGAYLDGYEKGKTDAEPRWIPVTERLPDDDSACFVTVKYRDIRYTDIAHCFASKDSSVRDWVGANDDDVLAWMPMPEPWKGENDAEID